MKIEKKFKHKNTQAHIPLTVSEMMPLHIMKPGKLKLVERFSVKKASNSLVLL